MGRGVRAKNRERVSRIRQEVEDTAADTITTIMGEVAQQAYDQAYQQWTVRGSWPSPQECYEQGMREGLAVMIRLFQTAPIDDEELIGYGMHL